MESKRGVTAFKKQKNFRLMLGWPGSSLQEMLGKEHGAGESDKSWLFMLKWLWPCMLKQLSSVLLIV